MIDLRICRSFSLMIKGIVSQSFFSQSMPVKGFDVPLRVDFPSIHYPLSQIRVGDVKFAKAYQIAWSFSHFSETCHFVQGIVSDDDAFEGWAEGFAYVWDLLPLTEWIEIGEGIELSGLSEFYEGYFSFVELLQQKRISFDGILIKHIFDSGGRR